MQETRDASPARESQAMPQLRRLDMNALLTFDVLMRTRSATAAARLLHKTQPAISRELARLRQVLDDPLLVVTRGRFIPTERALELHGAVHDALARMESALQESDSFDLSKARAVVNIGAGAHVDVLLGPRLLRRLHERAPGIILRFQTLHGDFDPAGLDDERLDIVLGNFVHIAPRFHRCTLFRDRRVCVLAADHPQAQGGPLTLDDLDTLRWFAFDQMYGRETRFDSLLKPLGQKLHFSAYLSGFGLTPYMLLGTGYATTMPAHVARAHQRHFPLAIREMPVPLEQLEILMVWARRQHTSPLLRAIRHEIRQAIDDALRESPDSPA